jgi:predicted outer membrane protein
MRRTSSGMGWMLAVAAAAAVLPVGVAAQEVEATDQNDRAAHAFLSAVDLGEVQQSLLAVERATSAEVRAYAQRMIDDHHNALHTREMLMQTERSGLMPAMSHGAHGAHGQGQATGSVPTGSGGLATGAQPAGGHDPARQSSTPPTHVAPTVPTGSGGLATGAQPAGGGGQGGAHAGHGSMAGGQGGAHAGHGVMADQGQGGMHVPPPEMIAELENVLRGHTMSRPVVEANGRNLQVLQGVTGPRFDPAYMDAQIGAHRYALQNIDRLLAQQNTLGDDIRGALQMARTAVAAHLQTAEQIRARLQ